MLSRINQNNNFRLTGQNQLNNLFDQFFSPNDIQLIDFQGVYECFTSFFNEYVLSLQYGNEGKLFGIGEKTNINNFKEMFIYTFFINQYLLQFINYPTNSPTTPVQLFNIFYTNCNVSQLNYTNIIARMKTICDCCPNFFNPNPRG